MSDLVLSLQNVEKSYRDGSIAVLQNANLQVKAGEIVALVAPSGAGKSTLLHIAGLLDTPDSGDVALNGRSMQSLSDVERTAARRCDLGFVYQFHHLLPEFSAVENVTLPQLANGVSRQDADRRSLDLLGAVGLSDRAHHRPAALSGGEQQRVAICRALANSPKLLLADEPTGNLDPATSDAVFDMLVGLVRQTGLSAVIATHNLALAARMDRTVDLQDGTLID